MILRVNPDVLLWISKRPGTRTAGTPLPRDAKVVNRMIDPRGDILLLVESDTYPETPEGSFYPEMTGPSFESPDPPAYRPLDDDFVERYNAARATDPRMPPLSDSEESLISHELRFTNGPLCGHEPQGSQQVVGLTPDERALIVQAIVRLEQFGDLDLAIKLAHRFEVEVGEEDGAREREAARLADPLCVDRNDEARRSRLRQDAVDQIHADNPRGGSKS